MKRFFTLILVIGVAVGGWYGYESVWGKPAEPSFRTADVSRGTIISTVTATGTVEPLVKVLVGSQVSGTVMRWFADFNHPVTENFVLAELDQDRYKRALDQRKAAVAVARANAEQAQARLDKAQYDLERIERLYKQSNAGEDELRTMRAAVSEQQAALHAAQAQIESAEAERDAAAVDLDKTIIRSPIDGVVISRDVDAGQTVAASLQTPNLFTIAADLRKMQVHANVSETDVGRVREGMTAEFTVDAYPSRKFMGSVSQVRFNPTILDNVVTYITLLDVENNDLALRPGMTATIAFLVDKADGVLVVPNAALRFRPDKGPDAAPGGAPQSQRVAAAPTIFGLESGRPRPLKIEVGLTDGTHTEVRGPDVKEGLAVIVEQVNRLGGPRPPSSMRPPRM